jgi:hypothetical protein
MGLMELLDFLRARLDEDEHLARECEAEVGPERAGDRFTDDSGDAGRDSFPSYPWGSGGAELAYMAGPGHPARVLLEVEAKRILLCEHRPVGYTNVALGIRDAQVCLTCHARMDEPDDWPEGREWGYPEVQQQAPCLTLRVLASVYADHPDYDAAQWAL